MEIQGKLIVKKDDQEVSASFKKREFVIETQDQYPQEIQLELHQDRVDLIDVIDIGTEIKCSINIRGKKYTPPTGGEDKWFNTIVCWKIEKVN